MRANLDNGSSHLTPRTEEATEGRGRGADISPGPIKLILAAAVTLWRYLAYQKSQHEERTARRRRGRTKPLDACVRRLTEEHADNH